MVTSSNARSASYNVDDEIDAMEPVNSLREDVNIHRRSCAKYSEACRLTSHGPSTYCCGSSNVYCEISYNRRSANAALAYEKKMYNYNLPGYCRCRAGTFPTSDGFDCTVCPASSPGTPCQSACCNPRSDGRVCCRSDNTPDGYGDTCCTNFPSTCSNTRCQSACCTTRSDGRTCCRGDGTPDGGGYACCTNFPLS